MTTTKGFTLIELMVVMAIMAVAYSLVGPNLFTAYQKMQIKAEQREFTEILKKISYKAFINGREVQLLLNGNLAQYGYLDESKTQQLKLEYIDFPEQTIVFSSSGFSDVPQYSIFIDQQLVDFQIDGVLNEG